MTTMPKLFVATPCYGGVVQNGYFKSILNLVKEIDCEVFTIPFDSLIPRARNACVTAFMKSDCSHFIFIDADISFNANDVKNMISADKDVLCGVYPKKALIFEDIKKHASKSNNIVELVSRSVGYAFNANSGQIENGILEITDGATGFMMIKKDVFAKMISEYPEKKYKNDVGGYESISENGYFYDLFPCLVDITSQGERRFLSEDYGFCRLWQSIGGRIYADLRVNLIHTGQFNFYGSPASVIHANSNQ